jgi:DMSO/TMAO reductase YedYZ molybdopterin-dependent catalytic subunit
MSSKLTRTSIVLVAALTLVIVASIFTYITYGQAKNSGVEQAKIILYYSELVSMPRTTVNADLYCVDSLIDHGNWTGVKLGSVLEKAGLNQQVENVEFHASDGYSITIPYSVAMRGDVIIAYEKDGSNLPELTRLVIPNAYGDEWISKITQIKIIFSSGNYVSIYLR